jgi:hypothetical protein
VLVQAGRAADPTTTGVSQHGRLRVDPLRLVGPDLTSSGAVLITTANALTASRAAST